MFRGKVISGEGFGRKLGYPTANLDTRREAVKLKGGIYAAFASCMGRRYPAALVVQEKPWKVEVHLINYDGADCYGRVLEVEAKQKVSQLEDHDDLDSLKKKISEDLELVKRVLKI